jgi:hypothetical protein
MRLMKLLRNAIIDSVAAGGLDLRECSFDFDDAASRITHQSGSYFLIEGDATRYVTTAVVGDIPPWQTGLPHLGDSGREGSALG